MVTRSFGYKLQIILEDCIGFAKMRLPLINVSSSKNSLGAAADLEGVWFSKLVENIPNSIVFRYCLVPQRGFKYVSPSVVHLTGYTPEEFYNDPLIFQKVIHPEDLPRFLASLDGKTRQGESIPMRWLRKDGGLLQTDYFSAFIYNSAGVIEVVDACARDVTRWVQAEATLRLNENRLEALLKLTQMGDASPQELTEFALEQAVYLTGSQYGYLAFTADDENVLTMHSWSKAATQACKVTQRQETYLVSETGLWGEAIRQRKPVITNDYLRAGSYSKGCPWGHVQLTRHMNVPIFEGERIVGVAGVANKVGPYDDSDVRQLTLLMDGLWRILQRNRVVAELRENEERYQVFLKSKLRRHLAVRVRSADPYGSARGRAGACHPKICAPGRM